VRSFEVDMPPTVEAKRTALARAGLSTDHVTFVETDFNQKSWFQAATEQGLDPTLPTFILWEGVTMYLDDEAVEATLRNVSRLAAGSRIAFDFLSREFVRAEAPFVWLGRFSQLGIRFYAEHWSFGVSTHAPARDHVQRLVTSQGLELAEYEPLGEERAPKAPLGGLAVAVRRD
jgi:methyltransferase (TIGR00027 family)